jgi:hypothetical protein
MGNATNKTQTANSEGTYSHPFAELVVSKAPLTACVSICETSRELYGTTVLVVNALKVRAAFDATYAAIAKKFGRSINYQSPNSVEREVGIDLLTERAESFCEINNH